MIHFYRTKIKPCMNNDGMRCLQVIYHSWWSCNSKSIPLVHLLWSCWISQRYKSILLVLQLWMIGLRIQKWSRILQQAWSRDRQSGCFQCQRYRSRSKLLQQLYGFCLGNRGPRNALGSAEKEGAKSHSGLSNISSETLKIKGGVVYSKFQRLHLNEI